MHSIKNEEVERSINELKAQMDSAHKAQTDFQNFIQEVISKNLSEYMTDRINIGLEFEKKFNTSVHRLEQSIDRKLKMTNSISSGDRGRKRHHRSRSISKSRSDSTKSTRRRTNDDSYNRSRRDGPNRNWTQPIVRMIANKNTIDGSDLNCVYCHGPHFSDKCFVITDATERWKHLKRTRRCHRCVNVIHKGACSHRCFYCTKTGYDDKATTHHSSTCLLPTQLMFEK
ncbi:unnamed protein product [Caenorhabditis bovis]|uniref:Uncharacterized protein n=1 Tax=Caenorhabditis bovis TaxID=2654633 RepID=A0A8S1FE15_9PELO|nr:unnamed protein product [Caenorhabditis bovis]